MLSSLLDQRTKDLAFFDVLDTAKVKSMIKEELIEIALESVKRNPPIQDPDIRIDEDAVKNPPQLAIFKIVSKRATPAAPVSVETEG